MLWNRSLVMYDPQTRTLWSHILGEAMAGPLKGAKLEQIPSVLTDWGTWKRQHPKTTVALLSRTANDFDRGFYRKLDRFVVALVHDDKAYAWRFDTLATRPVISTRLGKTPAVVVFSRQGMTARVFDRRVDGRTLTFQQKDNSLVDLETGTRWDPITGKAISGRLRGKHLVPLPAILSFRHAWRTFHPDTQEQ